MGIVQLLKVSLFIGLMIALLIMMAPGVRGPSTSITSLQAPSTELLGHSVTVTMVVQYDMAYNGKYLGLLVIDLDAFDGQYYSSPPGTTLLSGPDSCSPITSGKYRGTTNCTVTPSAKSGIITVTFTFQLSSVKTYSLEARALQGDSSFNVLWDVSDYRDFSITVKDKVSLSVYVPTAMGSITVTLDGASQNPGNVFATLYPGSHSLSVPSLVQVDNSTRLVFDHWSDGSGSPTRTVDLQDDTTLTANYVTQYKLNLVSSQGIPNGEGWYNSGTTARFSAPSKVSMSGFLGLLGGKWQFQGWYDQNGKLLSSSPNYTLSMDAGHTITAHWAADYSMPIIVLGVVAVVAVVLAYYSKRLPIGGFGRPRTRRTRRGVRRTRTVSEPVTEVAVAQETPLATETAKPADTEKPIMFCTQCGASLTRDSKFCKECGARV